MWCLDCPRLNGAHGVPRERCCLVQAEELAARMISAPTRQQRRAAMREMAKGPR
jgi:hypothetical protein